MNDFTNRTENYLTRLLTRAYDSSLAAVGARPLSVSGQMAAGERLCFGIAILALNPQAEALGDAGSRHSFRQRQGRSHM